MEIIDNKNRFIIYLHIFEYMNKIKENDNKISMKKNENIKKNTIIVINNYIYD